MEPGNKKLKLASHLLQRAGYTASAVARWFNVEESTFSRWLSGARPLGESRRDDFNKVLARLFAQVRPHVTPADIFESDFGHLARSLGATFRQIEAVSEETKIDRAESVTFNLFDPLDKEDADRFVVGFYHVVNPSSLYADHVCVRMVKIHRAEDGLEFAEANPETMKPAKIREEGAPARLPELLHEGKVSFLGELVALHGREFRKNSDWMVEVFQVVVGHNVMHGSAFVRGARGPNYAGLMEPVPVVAIKQPQMLANRGIVELELLCAAAIIGSSRR